MKEGDKEMMVFMKFARNTANEREVLREFTFRGSLMRHLPVRTAKTFFAMGLLCGASLAHATGLDFSGQVRSTTRVTSPELSSPLMRI